MRKPKIADKVFVRTWQTAEHTEDVAKKFGISNSKASQKAMFMRSKGVDLKRMPRGSRGPRKNWPELAELAKSLAA